MSDLKFANGEVHSCLHLATVPSMSLVYIIVEDLSFTDAAALFSDPDRTREMEYGQNRLVGYTTLDYLMPIEGGVKARLSGGRDELL